MRAGRWANITWAGGGGAIVLTRSVCGLMAVPGLGAYNAAKPGVVGLMQTLAV